MRTIAEMSCLDGRRALVTGAAGHIGLAASEALIEMGANVALVDLDADACSQRAEELSSQRKDSAFALGCDLKDETATREAVRQAISRMGGLDIIVHCAAYVGTTQVPGWAVSFQEQSVEAWDAAMRVNLTSAFVMVQEAQAALTAAEHGSVIFFASTYGLVGPDMHIYEDTGMANAAGSGASKGGLLQLMRYLSTVLAPKVRVNAITPGGVSRGQPELFQERYNAKTPLGRMAVEEDLKGAVAYLASDLSAYVTGHNLVVDGGWTAW
jgi:NAD(P)-dependent dehydrogenase (short-subunit alcohol dehydrogenase family)